MKNNDLLHQLRSINSQHTWLFKNQSLVYFPLVEKFITDDFGNTIILKEKQLTLISIEAKKLAHKLFKTIIKNHFKASFNNSKAKVRFPRLDKPRLILDSRLFDYSEAEYSTLFHSWLNISTLNKGQRVNIPLRLNQHFNGIKQDKKNKSLIPLFNKLNKQVSNKSMSEHMSTKLFLNSCCFSEFICNLNNHSIVLYFSFSNFIHCLTNI